MTEPAGEAPKSGGGLMEDVIEIFTKPSAVFERVRNAGFAKPALVQMVLFLVLALAFKNLMAPFTDAEFQRQMAKAAAKAAESGQQMPESATAMAEKMKNIFTIGGPLVLPWIMAIVGGVWVWICSKFVGAKLGYGQGATISAWSFMPAILGTVTMAIFGMVLDPQSIHGVGDGQLGLARFLDPGTASPKVLAVAQRVELFTFWAVYLRGIGISVIGRVSRASGMIAALAQWVLVTLILALFAR